MKARFGIVALILALTGCTHIQLRNNTARQANTVADMYTQQVMDNLAMFVYDPGSFPSFATFRQGTSQINDQGALAMPLGLGRLTGGLFGISTFAVNPSAQRAAQQAWTIDPVSDPRKLELMRCAYQRAVSQCAAVPLSSCPDCEKRFKNFYAGDPARGDIADAGAKSGITTSNCLLPGYCWFGAGCKQCMPDTCDCLYVGHHCGVYVWVLPEHRDELSKLTLAILDYALNEPKKPIQQLKTVTWYVDAQGNVTRRGRHAGTIAAVIDINDPPLGVITAPLQTFRNKLRNLLSDHGVLISELITDGPFDVQAPAGTKALTSSDRVDMIQWLAALQQPPAVALMDLLSGKIVSLKDVVEAHPRPPAGLTDAEKLELERIKLDFKSESRLKTMFGPREIPVPGVRGGGLEGLDLSDQLTPLVVPNLPSSQQPATILQLQQQLETVTPQPLLIPQ